MMHPLIGSQGFVGQVVVGVDGGELKDVSVEFGLESDPPHDVRVVRNSEKKRQVYRAENSFVKARPKIFDFFPEFLPLVEMFRSR